MNLFDHPGTNQQIALHARGEGPEPQVRRLRILLVARQERQGKCHRTPVERDTPHGQARAP